VSIRTLVNPDAREVLGGPAPDRAPLAFHRRLPGYVETPLVDVPGIAEALGVGKIWVKDESDRLGLPAFKDTGSHAVGCCHGTASHDVF
jgi:diaminopropionate ammonia-lyase